MHNNISSAAGRLPAVVLACAGAPEGDLNVVRSLGEQGVSVIVVGEYADPPSRYSRYCIEFVQVPDFGGHPQALLSVLADLSHRHGGPLPVFPSADPDLEVLSRLGDAARPYVRSTMADPALVLTLMDKGAFSELATRTGLPVPRTFTPHTLEEVEQVADALSYPAIAKPLLPTSWKHQDLPREIRLAKAIVVQSREELLDIGRTVAPCGLALILQEYVPGDDAEHYDVHAFIDQQGEARATFCGRKWRIQPPHVGSGCYVESLHEPVLEAMVVDILQRIDYRGIANLNFKRHSRTGEFKLLEINARVSQWTILTTRSGVNLPWMAYRDVCGLERQAPPPRQSGLWYVSGKSDFRAVRGYVREGLWTWAGYLGSLLKRPLVCQVLNLQDLGPARQLTLHWIAEKMRLRSPS
ncbi:ATP-grasp domain-containing protein [Sphaerotilus sp.]|uniref:carboxylate--amine ligase n=1 Tax=Sphaerotilus sp. TaxID=2093942 RepID=UPI0034E2BC4A